MLCLPTLVLAEIRCDTKSEALLTEKYISAVCGVYRDDCIILRELNNPSVFRVNITLAVHASYPVIAVAENIENLLTYSGHNVHIKNYIDRVCNFDTDFCKR